MRLWINIAIVIYLIVAGVFGVAHHSALSEQWRARQEAQQRFIEDSRQHKTGGVLDKYDPAPLYEQSRELQAKWGYPTQDPWILKEWLAGTVAVVALLGLASLALQIVWIAFQWGLKTTVRNFTAAVQEGKR